jgi:hypothetical protein
MVGYKTCLDLIHTYPTQTLSFIPVHLSDTVLIELNSFSRAPRLVSKATTIFGCA